MSQRPTAMRCPSCGAHLVELERSDVLIDACPQCRGVWLERGELDKILDRERRAVADVRDDEDFLREVTGRHRDHEHGRFGGDRREEKRRRRRSFLEELFDD